MQALAELAQAAQIALDALAQVGLAALGFVAVVPKLLRGVRATDLKPLLFRLCWFRPTCRLYRPEALSPPGFPPHAVFVSEVTRWCCCCLLVGLP